MSLEDISEQILLESRIGLTPVNQTANRVVSILLKAGIKCALVGGYAVHMYGYSRFTDDTDFVVSDKEYALDVLKANGFKAIQGSSMSVTDRLTGVTVDLLATGAKDSPNAHPYPDPANHVVIREIPVINLEDLIGMKLSSFLTSGLKRLRDKSDVIELIQKRNLPINFMDRYPETIVNEYRSIWDELNRSRF